MSPAAAVSCTIAGSALIAIVLRDAFETLFHPDGRRTLSRAVMRASWRGFHRLGRGRPGSLALAGPCTLVAILGIWALLLALGWALLLWPHFPAEFRFARELAPAHRHGLVEAFYVSLVTLGTIGYGDISPASGLMRLLAPAEALVGFALLSAAISWLLSVYPALSRRRSLAYEMTLLRDALGPDGQLDFARRSPRTAERVFAELLSRLVAVERDLVTIPLSYYFGERDERFSLAAVMPWLLELADHSVSDAVPEPARLRARMLRAAIDDFARTAAMRFHGAGGADSAAALLAQYARDHLREPVAARDRARSRYASSSDISSTTSKRSATAP
jgi:ion channel